MMRQSPGSRRQGLLALLACCQDFPIAEGGDFVFRRRKGTERVVWFAEREGADWLLTMMQVSPIRLKFVLDGSDCFTARRALVTMPAVSARRTSHVSKFDDLDTLSVLSPSLARHSPQFTHRIVTKSHTIMVHRTRVVLAKTRQIVRDPRRQKNNSKVGTTTKARTGREFTPVVELPQHPPTFAPTTTPPSSSLMQSKNLLQTQQPSQPQQQRQQHLPFEPSHHQQQQSVGSSMVSYMLAGAGVAMGFTLVGAIFGGF